MRYELKSLPLWPATKIAFFVNLALGLIIGLLLAVFMMPIMSMLAAMEAYDGGSDLNLGAAPLGALTVFVPIMTALWFAFANTITVILVVLVYNLMARFAGGLELDLSSVEPTSIPQPTVQPQAPVAAASLPLSDKPQPPPTVIPQPEPGPAEVPSPRPTEESGEAGANNNKNDNE